MHKQTIKYRDIDGTEVEGEYYFHLDKAEIIELNLGAGENGLEGLIEKLIMEKNSLEIYNIFKKIILTAYGKRVIGDDGLKRFTKKGGVADEFLESGAFSELIVSMMENPRTAAEFIAACLPADIQAANKAQLDKAKAEIAAATESE